MRNGILSLLLALAGLPYAYAAGIEPLGVLGNSGELGAALLRVGSPPLEALASGAAVDGDLTLWLSGGDAIHQVSLDGRLLERFPLEPAGSLVDSKTFAVLDNKLYFLGRLPKGEPALFGLAMTSGDERRSAKPLPVPLPARKRQHVPYCLSPQPLNGQLLMAAEPQEFEDDRIGVYFISPEASYPAPPQPAFTLAGQQPGGLAVDAARGVIYLGGNLGLYVGGTTHGTQYVITALRPDGKPLSAAFPVPCPKTPAIPSQFRGIISLVGGALWDTAWYGFLARLDLEGRGAPGRVVQWHHELGYPTQVVGIGSPGPPHALAASPATGDGGRRPDLLGITTAGPEAFYLARWDEARPGLSLASRIGCLPTIASLGLSGDGWVTVGTARAQLWWRWEDSADAPPRKAGLHIGVTPQFHREEQFFALAAQYRLDDLKKRPPVPAVFTRREGSRNEAERQGDPVPMKQPVGLSVQVTPGKSEATLFVVDAASRQVWCTRFWLPQLQPTNDNWEPISIQGLDLKSPTDIVALTDGRLILAEGSHILMLELRGKEYAVAWQMAGWGDGPQERFGSQLRLAVDGPWMLVSDTQRHRLVWLDWAEKRFLAQFGQTDKPGNDSRHLDSPTLVDLKGTCAVVADSGNQRVVKLALAP